MKRRDAIKNSLILSAAGLSAVSISNILSGCNEPSTTSVVNKVVNDQQSKMIDAITQIIIPTTDTPGAKEAQILPDFISHIESNFSKEDQDEFMVGLGQIDETSKGLFTNAFINLEETQKESVLNAIADKGGEKNIFEAMKWMTVYLFFTSEIGATKVLNYLPIPGPFQPCVDLKEVGATWAL
jgi:hypothetical protein